MLPKIHRLRLTNNFGRLKKEGRMINGPLFGLLVVQTAGQQVSRSAKFGFIVSTKIDKRAVIRNRIRRLLSEAVRLNLGRVKPGYEIVFLAKKSLVGRDFKQVKREMIRALTRARLLV